MLLTIVTLYDMKISDCDFMMKVFQDTTDVTEITNKKRTRKTMARKQTTRKN